MNKCKCGREAELLLNGIPTCERCYKTVTVIHEGKEYKKVWRSTISLRLDFGDRWTVRTTINNKTREVWEIGKDLFSTTKPNNEGE